MAASGGRRHLSQSVRVYERPGQTTRPREAEFRVSSLLLYRRKWADARGEARGPLNDRAGGRLQKNDCSADTAAVTDY